MAAGDVTPGRRVYADGDWIPKGEPGDYVEYRGKWYCTTPNGANGALGNHDVTEHDDGTITVSPSILVYPHNTLDDAGERYQHPGWHGYLERGQWREV